MVFTPFRLFVIDRVSLFSFVFPTLPFSAAEALHLPTLRTAPRVTDVITLRT